MDIYSVWPAFAVLAVLLVVFSYSPFFRFIDDPPGTQAKRISALDGLRGFLALGVFLHHAVVTYAYIKDGNWLVPPSRFYVMIGQASVSLFFMVSGFLFWQRLLREQDKIKWVQLYLGRVFRIGPLYLVAIFCMFVIVFAQTGFTLHEPLGKIAGEMGPWLGLGLLRKPDINGYQHTRLILAGVTWSLYFEWLFYFSLRVTWYMSGPKRRLVFVLGGWAAALAATFLLRGSAAAYIALFFSGMTAATLIQDGYVPKLKPWLASLGAIACLALALMSFDEVHNGLCVVLLALFFFIVCMGNDLFGLLTCKAAQRLGHISYGIYLMQGIALTLFYWPDSARTFSLADPAHYWLSVMGCALVLTLGASALYILIEKPGIALGRRAVKAVAQLGRQRFDKAVK